MRLGDLIPAEFKAQMGTTHGWLGESRRASFSSKQWSEETGHVTGAELFKLDHYPPLTCPLDAI